MLYLCGSKIVQYDCAVCQCTAACASSINKASWRSHICNFWAPNAPLCGVSLLLQTRCFRFIERVRDDHKTVVYLYCFIMQRYTDVSNAKDQIVNVQNVNNIPTIHRYYKYIVRECSNTRFPYSIYRMEVHYNRIQSCSVCRLLYNSFCSMNRWRNKVI